MPQRNLDTLERYLLRGEKIVVAVHRHWATVAEPVALAILGLIVALWLSASLSANAMPVGDLVWWLWFALAGRAIFCLWEWRREWFIATDRRLLLVYGFIVRKVDMMPLGKVTDMTYHRTVPGRILGYGTFVLESAGQDQALSNLQFIPRPDQTYKAIIAEIFHKAGDEVIEGPDDDYAAQAEYEEDPGRRRLFTEHLRRFSWRQRSDDDEPGPIHERRTSRGRREPRGVPMVDDDEPGRSRGGYRPPEQDPDDDLGDTGPLDLGGLARSGGRTIYRSADSDGTDDPHYEGYRDPTGS